MNLKLKCTKHERISIDNWSKSNTEKLMNKISQIYQFCRTNRYRLLWKKMPSQLSSLTNKIKNNLIMHPREVHLTITAQIIIVRHNKLFSRILTPINFKIQFMKTTTRKIKTQIFELKLISQSISMNLLVNKTLRTIQK